MNVFFPKKCLKWQYLGNETLKKLESGTKQKWIGICNSLKIQKKSFGNFHAKVSLAIF